MKAKCNNNSSILFFLAFNLPETQRLPYLSNMKKQLEKVSKALGIRISTAIDDRHLPAEFKQLQEKYIDDAIDDHQLLKEAISLAKRYPDEPDIQYLLVTSYVVADEDKKARKEIAQLVKKFPDNISLVTLFISMQESPEATFLEGARLGEPADIKRFKPQADGAYSLLDYIDFEGTALRVDIAAGGRPLMWERMERLLSLNHPEEMVVQNLAHYFNCLIQEEIDHQRITPPEWIAPKVPASLPLTKKLIGQKWEEFKAEFMEEVIDLFKINPFVEGGLSSLLSGLTDETPRRSSSKEIKSPQKRNARKMKTKEVYQLKVTLEYSKPPIWRRLLVTSDTSLADMHYIIQGAFGWKNCHLHQFQQGQEYYAQPNPHGFDDYSNDYTGLTIADFLQKPKDKLRYEYDFGDSWLHKIELQKILPIDPNQTYPLCTAGKRNCPPEDIGGVWGYEEFLEIIKNPKHPEYKKRVAWIGEKFDPEAFNLAEINSRL